MIQLLFEIIIALSFSYLILVKILKSKIEIKSLIIIGLCFYIVEIALYVYRGTKIPKGTISVTADEIANPRDCK